ncbi:hypothetical protein ADIS_1798 [Lunatimonas lonarensis]|uniref:Uncharacterized protein n=1 Tax=Lunatimonas lonarensis TaxID=1232681 RepID=R7ZUC3_9BACT|nr:hypothetical protein [Lunatimonas lonarensis]EON77579.1 hypothetical protein ADIS_1798 [Lunatimonas lonarensis]
MLSWQKVDIYPIETRIPEDSAGLVNMSDVIDGVWYVKLGDTPPDLMSDF